MSKEKVGNMKGRKFVFETGDDYKFEVMDFKVKDAEKCSSGYPLVVVDLMCIGTAQHLDVFGKRSELTFSMSPQSQSITHAWLLALGFSDEDSVEVTDASVLEAELRSKAKGAVIICNLEKLKRGEFYQNNVVKPWEVEASARIEGDYQSGDEACPF